MPASANHVRPLDRPGRHRCCGARLLSAGAHRAVPFETLSWWSGWGKDRPAPDASIELAETEKVIRQPAGRYCIVYLSGVGRLTGDARPEKEEAFLDRLQAQLPNAIIVRDVFPFSVTNNPLTGKSRALAGVWCWIDGLQQKRCARGSTTSSSSVT